MRCRKGFFMINVDEKKKIVKDVHRFRKVEREIEIEREYSIESITDGNLPLYTHIIVMFMTKFNYGTTKKNISNAKKKIIECCTFRNECHKVKCTMWKRKKLIKHKKSFFFFFSTKDYRAEHWWALNANGWS